MQRHHGLANAQRITIIWPTPPLLLVPCLGAVKPFRILRLHKGRWRRLCRCGEEPVGHRTNFPDRDSHLLRIPRLLAQGRRRCGQVVALRNEGSIRRFRGGELRTIRVRCWVLRFATAALRVAGSWDELLPGCVCRILAQLQQHHEVRVQRERLVHHQVGKATGGVRQEGVPCKQSSERQVVVKGTQLAAAAFQSVREASELARRQHHELIEQHLPDHVNALQRHQQPRAHGLPHSHQALHRVAVLSFVVTRHVQHAEG
mmetsp:Transcript_13554/g.50457  ORF Transcript_13554/g.50457 Transcript_13554/m.50457 type:complete len:259 (+) Transcript_13554:731-1507(+)